MPLAVSNGLLFIAALLLARALEFPLFVTLFVIPLMVYGLWGNRTKQHKLAGATVLVTGASSGLGRAIAHEAALRGAKRVLLVARTESKLQEVHKEIRALTSGTEPVVLTCDVTDPGAVQALREKVEAKYGTPDILVNNAGAGAWLHLEETSPEEAQAHMACPYQAAFSMSRVFIEGMAARGSGHIVNVTSAASLVGFRGAVSYGTARWAMRGFSQYLRADLAKLGIGVTLINAAEIGDTEYFSNEAGKAGGQSHQRIPSLFQLSLIQRLSYTSQQTATAALRAVEQGTHEALIPFHLLFGVDWLNRVLPDVFHALLRLGPAGRRSQG
jgi:short-subunit dehydrogenase